MNSPVTAAVSPNTGKNADKTLKVRSSVAKLLESDSKILLRNFDILVPQSWIATTPDEAKTIASKFKGKLVIKPLIPAGKRGLAGAVKFVSGAEETYRAAGELLGCEVHGYPVNRILLEERVNIATELYLSITFDYARKKPVILACTEGGIEIEEVVKRDPAKVLRQEINILEGLRGFKAIQMWEALGLRDKTLLSVARVSCALYKVFASVDAKLAEINPLAITPDNEVVAASAVINLDDNALFRHPDLMDKVQTGAEKLWRPLTEREKSVIAANLSDPQGSITYVEFDDGDFANAIGAAGASILALDIFDRHGVKPANYMDINATSYQKAYQLYKAVLSKPGVKGAIMGSNINSLANVGIRTRAFIQALKDVGFDAENLPVVMRVGGEGEEEAREVASSVKGIKFFGGDEATFPEAVEYFVHVFKQRGARVG